MGHGRSPEYCHACNRKPRTDESGCTDHSGFCHSEPADKNQIRLDQPVWRNPGRPIGRVSPVDEEADGATGGASGGSLELFQG